MHTQGLEVVRVNLLVRGQLLKSTVKRKQLPLLNWTCIIHQKCILCAFSTKCSNLLGFNATNWKLVFKIDTVDINLYLIKM